MKLIRIGSGQWQVLAVCDARGNCDVLAELYGLGQGNKAQRKLADRMLQILTERVPNDPNGPRFLNEYIVKPLRDGIFEFKRGQKTGLKLRVLWFYSAGMVVVCTACFLKTNKTPANLIDEAIMLKQEYERKRKSGKIEIVDLDDA